MKIPGVPLPGTGSKFVNCKSRFYLLRFLGFAP